MTSTCFVPRKSTVFAVMTSLAALMAPALAHADIGSDMRNDPSLRLWLDWWDPNAQDIDGITVPTIPADGSVITTWRDKSIYGHDATGRGTWRYAFGVSLYPGDGFSLPSSVYGNGPSRTMEIFTFVRANDPVPIYGLDGPLITMQNSDGGGVQIRAGNSQYGQSRIGIVHKSNIFAQDASIGEVHGSYSASYVGGPGARSPVEVWSGALHNFQVDGASSSLWVGRDGGWVASASTTVPHYSNTPGGVFNLGGSYNGQVSAVMIFDRILRPVERRLLTEYLAIRNRDVFIDTISMTGLYNRMAPFFTMSGDLLYPFQTYNGQLGGIGQASGSSVSTGTSAGLTVTNVNFLRNGAYLLFATNLGSSSRYGAWYGTTNYPTLYSQPEFALLPSQYPTLSNRKWYLDNTSGNGNVKMRFDLNTMGISLRVGQQVAVMYTVAGGIYTPLASALYNGSGSIEFTVNNPKDGVYALGFAAPPPPPPNIVQALTSVSQSDGVSSSNFYNLPGSILRQTASFTNNGAGSPGTNTVTVDVPIESSTKLRLVDMGTVGSGPVQFVGSTTPPVGLSYTYSGLASTTDSLSFSNDNGATYTYTPMPDADQADANVTHFRVSLPGTFNFSTKTPYPTFTLTYDVKIK